MKLVAQISKLCMNLNLKLLNQKANLNKRIRTSTASQSKNKNNQTKQKAEFMIYNNNYKKRMNNGRKNPREIQNSYEKKMKAESIK